jgi:acyl dehydratase
LTIRGLFYEDFTQGRTFITERRTITETDQINFVTSFGFFEPLFTDKTYAETQTPYQKRIVPGALTFSMAEGLTILSGILHGTGLAFLGVEMTILRPVFIGDTISVRIEVLDRRETQKPDRGIVTYKHQVKNQLDQAVMDYRIKRMLRRKN